jgi:hypothetical protein
MTHLTAIEIVDFLDGQLDTQRAAHLDDCAVCRAQADQLRATLEGTALDIPEPSPLFWEHFSTQVRDRVAKEQVEGTGLTAWLAEWPRTALATCAAIVLLTLAGATIIRRESPRSPEPTVPPTAADALFTDDMAAEVAWAEVQKAAERVGLDEAHQAGITAPQESAERAIRQLTDRERQELISLLEAEMKRSGA